MPPGVTVVLLLHLVKAGGCRRFPAGDDHLFHCFGFEQRVTADDFFCLGEGAVDDRDLAVRAFVEANATGTEMHSLGCDQPPLLHAHFDPNRKTTPRNMRWKIIDPASGAVGKAIDWGFRVGDRVKIRLVNEMESDHPMHHPFHIHGAGRFLILSRDGVVEPNLVWKDTVLVPTGQTVDLLLEVINPGLWMARCHIAEHHESGMMFSFKVTDSVMFSARARQPF